MSHPLASRPLRAGRTVLAVIAALVLLPGCAVIPLLVGGDDASAGAEPSDEASAAGTTVSSLDGVEAAVVRIVAEGTFVDPEQGELLNVAGSGSGFIIDSEGIAVTNNHVVTGAALLDVFVAGEEQPRNARVLGVSECSDLAVIDIEGDGFTSLAWNTVVPDVGSEVYAAGHPLGDSEFTLTNGIVSRASQAGESSWASVDSVLLHDATINPGNSGGPLVDADAQVVGVNYAGDSATGQFFAIAADEALPLIEQLRSEENLTTIGVNGEAFALEDGTSGIWVSSVDSGSPADTTGVRGGDIITRLENLVVGVDGTMSDYCDVLRSHTAADVLAIEVLRTSTSEVFAGQINGDELVVTQTFAGDLRGSVPADSGDEGSYGEYYEVRDDTGAISVSVPVEWDDVDGAGLALDETRTLPALSVTPDAAAFNAGFDAPGAIVAASSELAVLAPDQVIDLLGAEVAAQCTSLGREAYDDGLYAGTYELYGSCGGTETVIVVLAAKPTDGSYMVIVAVQATSARDLTAMDRILETFQVVGDV